VRSDQLRTGTALSCGCFGVAYRALQGRTMKNHITAAERQEARRQLEEMKAWVKQARQESRETAAQATSARMAASLAKRLEKARK